MKENEMFDQLLRYLQEKYPSAGITQQGTLIFKDRECLFNTDGFSLLCNITRLCDAYKAELR